MWDEIEGRDGRKRTAPPREAVVIDVAPTVEDSAAAMPRDAKGVDPQGRRQITLLAQVC